MYVHFRSSLLINQKLNQFFIIKKVKNKQAIILNILLCSQYSIIVQVISFLSRYTLKEFQYLLIHFKQILYSLQYMIFLCKLIFLIVVPLLLLFASYRAYEFATINELFVAQAPPKITYEVYNMQRTEYWKKRFDFLDSKDYNSLKRRIVGNRQNYLQVRRGYQTYLIQYDAQIDLQLIQQVREIREADDKTAYTGRYFLVQYDKFVEVVFFDISKSSTPLSSQVENGTYEAAICLELPIQNKDNIRYHIDESNNVWIVTASMNKVIFIQIYSCIQAKIVRQYRYVLEEGQFVNEIAKIIRKDKHCMQIQAIKYDLSKSVIQVCPYLPYNNLKEVQSIPAIAITHQQIQSTEYEILTAYNSKSFEEEMQKIYSFLLHKNNDFPRYRRLADPLQNQKEEYDVIVVDQDNNYMVSLSKNATHTGLLSLNKFMISSEPPLFHNNQNYQEFGVLQFLEKEHKQQYSPITQYKYIQFGTNQSKKAYYKQAYKTYPSTKTKYLGMGDKILVYWPPQTLEEKDMSYVRTRQGALVSQGRKFKGTFDKFPVKFQQIYQKLDTDPKQLVPGIYEIHIVYRGLMTYLVESKDGKQFQRIELVNMLGGRSIMSHYFNLKQGYSYVSTTLINSQWWILQYNKAQKKSIATKYELFVNASNPSVPINVKRVYGIIGSEQHLNGQDDLAELMSQFVQKHKNGYQLLSIYRCIDEYYYIQYTDDSGSVYGVARIHFKNLSNRRVKKNQKYSGNLQKVMLVDEKNMIKEKYSRQPYAVYLKNIDVFSHIPHLNSKNNLMNTWQDYCDSTSTNKNFRKLQKYKDFYYLPLNYFSSSSHGCNKNLDEVHSEQISVFNMRSIIIDGKVQKETKKQIKKTIILAVFAITAGYILLALVYWILDKIFGTKIYRQNQLSDEQLAALAKNIKKKKEN